MSPPWMPLYVADYLADTGHLSTEEHGAYLLLIMHYWRTGGLPTDDLSLALITRLPAKRWLAARPKLEAFFDDGWKHGRIEQEMVNAGDKHNRRSEAGKRGGKASARSRQKGSNASSNASSKDEAGLNHLSQPPYSEAKASGGGPPILPGRTDDFEADAKAVVAGERPSASPAPEVPLPPPMMEVPPETPKARLWRVGRPALMALGVSKRDCGEMMGRWLNDCGDDYLRVLSAIQRARDMAPSGPIAWITASLKSDERHARKAESLQDAASALVEFVRAQEGAGPSTGPVLTVIRGGEDEGAPRQLQKGTG